MPKHDTAYKKETDVIQQLLIEINIELAEILKKISILTEMQKQRKRYDIEKLPQDVAICFVYRVVFCNTLYFCTNTTCKAGFI
jgi:hypothetical protein